MATHDTFEVLIPDLAIQKSLQKYTVPICGDYCKRNSHVYMTHSQKRQIQSEGTWLLHAQPLIQPNVTKQYTKFLNSSISSITNCWQLTRKLLIYSIFISIFIKRTPWPESASELYRASYRRLSAKFAPTFVDRGCRMISVTDPYGSIGFLDRSRYFFFQAAPQLYPRGWVNPVPDPLLLRKFASVGNRTQTSGSVARNSDHLNTVYEQNISNRSVVVEVHMHMNIGHKMTLICRQAYGQTDDITGTTILITKANMYFHQNLEI
jgi:hypothetical protein